MFHPHWRQKALAQLDEVFDLVVVGGGINGCGVLLDAAQRGLRTLLVERDDLAAGTSSRSSKLIHGGLRYLRQMQVRVTRLSCAERDRMVELSPHLVRPVRFLYPAHRGDKVPGWGVELGLRMYDRLTRASEKHSRIGVERMQQLAPGIKVEDIDRTLSFFDAQTDDARLTLAVATTAFAYGGLVLTRAEAIDSLMGDDGRIHGVVLRDLEDGRAHRVRAHVVVNATGHWVDSLREALGLTGRRVRPSRGSHLVFSHASLPLSAGVGFPSPDDGRFVFTVPHPDGVLAGTTDLYHDGPLDDPRPTPEEAGYILRAVQARFPGRPIGPGDVIGAFAGLRPILHTHAESPSEASREEAIWEENGLLSVAGGKLTTWRVTAEEAVDESLQLLPEERVRVLGRSLTKGTPLAGLAPPDLDRAIAEVHGMAPDVARAMARRLGSTAWLACSLARDARELAPLADGTDLTAAEVRAALRFGAALRVEDLLLRRARVGMWNPALARELVPYVAPLFAEELGWDATRREREEDACARALAAWRVDGLFG